jgi:hypothetical protein
MMSDVGVVWGLGCGAGVVCCILSGFTAWLPCKGTSAPL